MKSYAHSKLILVGAVVVAVCGMFLVYQSATSDKDVDQTREISERSEGNKGSAQNAAETAEADIVLKNLGLASVNASTAYTRFAVQDYASNGMKGMYLFGDALPGNRLNPNLEFASVKQDAPVIAAIDGVVVFIREQSESKDYEVFLQPKNGSVWTVGYDHLVGLRVKQGDRVTAGDVLGTAAVQNNGLYRFELQVNKDVAGQTTHHCPVQLLDPGISAAALADLTASQAAWEAVRGQDLYNPATQNPVGCIKATLSVAEAEGR
jgi:murein DD-endopeptidase MepM/ murein hydrolase activator NlpD